MAVIGGLVEKVAGRFRDLTTGRFISAVDARSILENEPLVNFHSAAARGRFERSQITLMERYGLSRKQAEENVSDFLRRSQAWRETGRGGDEPSFDSPPVRE